MSSSDDRASTEISGERNIARLTSVAEEESGHDLRQPRDTRSRSFPLTDRDRESIQKDRQSTAVKDHERQSRSSKSGDRSSLQKERQSTSVADDSSGPRQSRDSKFEQRSSSLQKDRQSTVGAAEGSKGPRQSRDSKSGERSSVQKDRQSTAVAKVSAGGSRQSRDSESTSLLSIYNVRFPANICEHQLPNFTWQPAPSPGRGGGSIVGPVDPAARKTTRKSPRKAAAAAERKPGARARPETSAGDQPEEVKMSVAAETGGATKESGSGEVKMIKRETKNR